MTEKIVWHNLMENPKDLPPASGEFFAERKPILAYTKELGVTTAIRRKHGRGYEWHCSNYDGNTLFLDREVIAWAELPKCENIGKSDTG
jgi:hypothetical protein